MSTKAVVRINEMPPEMAEEAFIHGMDALETQFNESDMAAYVKEKFEEQYGGLWHCFVGRNFGAFVTHEENKIIYFYIQQTGFLLCVILCHHTLLLVRI
jgi:dynein light chain LC8-type